MMKGDALVTGFMSAYLFLAIETYHNGFIFASEKTWPIVFLLTIPLLFSVVPGRKNPPPFILLVPVFAGCFFGFSLSPASFGIATFVAWLLVFGGAWSRHTKGFNASVDVFERRFRSLEAQYGQRIADEILAAEFRIGRRLNPEERASMAAEIQATQSTFRRAAE